VGVERGRGAVHEHTARRGVLVEVPDAAQLLRFVILGCSLRLEAFVRDAVHCVDKQAGTQVLRRGKVLQGRLPSASAAGAV